MNMADDQRKVSVNKPLAPWVPTSQRDSGVNLDDGCGDIEQASAGSIETFGSDALRQIQKERK
jgi:hypothetical protein